MHENTELDMKTDTEAERLFSNAISKVKTETATYKIRQKNLQMLWKYLQHLQTGDAHHFTCRWYDSIGDAPPLIDKIIQRGMGTTGMGSRYVNASDTLTSIKYVLSPQRSSYAGEVHATACPPIIIGDISDIWKHIETGLLQLTTDAIRKLESSKEPFPLNWKVTDRLIHG